LEEVKGVGGGAGEGILIEHLFGEGADERLAAEWAMVLLPGALEDVSDMEGAFGGQEYVIYNIHIRLTFGPGRGDRPLGGAAERAQGAKLSRCAGFEDINEVVLS
jgi:hypothetical protein